MVKVLFFIDRLHIGGAEKVMCSLVNNMDQEKFDITVQTIWPANKEEYLVPGIRYKTIFPQYSHFYRWIMRIGAAFGWLYPLCIKDNYDVEVAYLECAPTKIIARSTNQKAKKYAWVHCDLLQKEGMAKQLDKMKSFYCAYDKVVCVSEKVKESFESIIGEHPEAVVLHNVNDEKEILKKAEAFSVMKRTDIQLVAVGRLYQQKAFDRLLEACSMLKQDGYRFNLQILGEGPERPNLETIIREKQLGNCVELMGFRENPYPYIKTADIIVCSSRYEGMSTVITEALILGKAVVTTPCTGMKELLGDSTYGMITEDSAAGLYAGIKKMLDNPELLRNYANAAEERGKDFYKHTILRKTEAFLLSE